MRRRLCYAMSCIALPYLQDEEGGEGVVDDRHLLDPREPGRDRASLVEQAGEEDHGRDDARHCHRRVTGGHRSAQSCVTAEQVGGGVVGVTMPGKTGMEGGAESR